MTETLGRYDVGDRSDQNLLMMMKNTTRYPVASVIGSSMNLYKIDRLVQEYYRRSHILTG